MQLGVMWNWWDKGSNATFAQKVLSPDFENVTLIHLIGAPENIKEQVTWLANNLPDRPFDFFIESPLCYLTGTEGLQTRDMMVAYMGRQPAPMKVPLLNADNLKAVSDFHCSSMKELKEFTENVSQNFLVLAIGACTVSTETWDAESSIPNNYINGIEQTALEALTDWSSYDVTIQSVADYYASHCLALKQATAVDYVVYYQLNPLLSIIGHAGDGGAGYNLIGHSCIATETESEEDDYLLIFDQTNVGALERPIIRGLAQEVGHYACQCPGTIENVLAALKDANEHDALWAEVPPDLLPEINTAGLLNYGILEQ